MMSRTYIREIDYKQILWWTTTWESGAMLHNDCADLSFYITPNMTYNRIVETKRNFVIKYMKCSF